MFDGVTGDLIKAELRAGNVYTSRRAVRFIGPVSQTSHINNPFAP
jgi:hypothetical protein